MRLPFRPARSRGRTSRLPEVRRPAAGALDLTPGSSQWYRQTADSHLRWSSGRWVLRRWLPIALALTGRLPRLRELLPRDQSVLDDDESLLWAAVAVVLAPNPDSILLIRRAERSGDPWSGHVALPGGRRETGDATLLDTAIRETWEEVGFRLSPVDLAGVLEDVIPRTPVLPPIAVRPYVFVTRAQPETVLSAEVSTVSWVHLDHLILPQTHHLVRLEVGGEARLVQAYELPNGIVWGMTERIITGLLKYFRQ
jgi:8-oxo-dGTP pyrophosphatase MutT (NUDIX family)